MPRFLLPYTHICLVLYCVLPPLAMAQPRPAERGPADAFLRQLEQATPADRVNRLLNYFDTCQAVVKNQTYALRLLTEVDALAQRNRDERLKRYVRFVRDTHRKHHMPTHADIAALFLAVGEQAEAEDDAQIAAVCRHFVGQYYFLNGDYGPAFEYLLAAN